MDASQGFGNRQAEACQCGEKIAKWNKSGFCSRCYRSWKSKTVVASGLCCSCKKQPLVTRWRCAECRQRDISNRRIVSDLKREIGQCVSCNRPACVGRRTCAKCRRVLVAKRAGKNDNRRSTYLARIAAGVCVRCGQSPAEEGVRRCAVCAAIQRKKSKMRRSRKRAAGLCVGCGVRKAQQQRSRCRKCLDAINAYCSKRYREKKRKRQQ